MNKEKQIEEMAKVLSTVKRCDAFDYIIRSF